MSRLQTEMRERHRWYVEQLELLARNVEDYLSVVAAGGAYGAQSRREKEHE